VNCVKGIAGANGGAPYCHHLAALGAAGINYLNASASEPSDSFPGLMAIVSGGSPGTVGAFYDVAYDRVHIDPARILHVRGYGTMTPRRILPDRPRRRRSPDCQLCCATLERAGGDHLPAGIR
jgi:Type I phosphodiesterase / nucleotide pyrophosphatase